METYTTLVNIIGNFGFPIFVALYLFIRFEKKLEKLEKAIVELGNNIRGDRK
ncbi:YvrJ family protein [Peribacillus frigoritolerans]|uniref:YvrJ family protein n=1 Tax=Peribacillus frigoritolerans TaxID=450367 RepID=UPI0024C16295|nr:YvrJ family protein [Peribacillus frigoritolerans]WHX66050.1 YvrJ family protein [Peribacillus frigoritolerans]WVN10057.1 YvrJ family protein [Peribacillus frigoritolerans]